MCSPLALAGAGAPMSFMIMDLWDTNGGRC
jgi:hypothetical protein